LLQNITGIGSLQRHQKSTPQYFVGLDGLQMTIESNHTTIIIDGGLLDILIGSKNGE